MTHPHMWSTVSPPSPAQLSFLFRPHQSFLCFTGDRADDRATRRDRGRKWELGTHSQSAWDSHSPPSTALSCLPNRHPRNQTEEGAAVAMILSPKSGAPSAARTVNCGAPSQVRVLRTNQDAGLTLSRAWICRKGPTEMKPEVHPFPRCPS